MCMTFTKYNSLDDILEELKPIVDEVGDMPTRKQLVQRKKSGILYALSPYGGLKKAYEVLGINPKQKKDYWNEENIIKEVKEILTKLGHIPTQKELKDMGRSDLLSAIDRNGGMELVYKLMNTPAKRKRNYWNKETIIAELIEIINEIGEYPTQKKLLAMGRSDLATAIVRSGLSYEIRKELSAEYQAKPKGYWTKERIIDEIRLIYRSDGKLPSSSRLKELKRGDLINAINNQGGMNFVYDEFNLRPLQKKNYWTFEKIVQEVKVIANNLGKVPTLEELRSMGRWDLSGAINKYTNMTAVYEALSERPKRKVDFWNNEKIEAEVKRIIYESKEFPSADKLRERNRNDLVAAINNYGGFRKLRENIGFKQISNPYEYYKDFNNVLQVINEFKIQHDEKFPTVCELEEFRPGIKAGIRKYHGGYRNVRDKLNEPQICKENGYWKDISHVKKAIQCIIDKIGMIPSSEQIERYGEPGLYAAIAIHHDGLESLYEVIGFNYKSNKSKFEKRVKLLLSRELDCDLYVDNKRKKLYTDFGIKLINPKTGRWMEYDRYYYTYRVAIEIQGEQHDKEVEYFAKMLGVTAKEYLEAIKFRDESKSGQSIEQDVTLLYIRPSMSDEEIVERVSEYIPRSVQPLDIIIDDEDYTLEQIGSILKELYDMNGNVTSDMVRNYSYSLYNEVIKIFGGIYKARENFDIPNEREERGSWNLDKICSRIKKTM